MPKELTENLKRIIIRLCKELDLPKKVAVVEFAKENNVFYAIIHDSIKEILDDCEPGKFRFSKHADEFWSIAIDQFNTELYQLMGPLATILSGKTNYAILRKIQSALEKNLLEINSDVLKEVVSVTSSYNKEAHEFRATLQIDGMPFHMDNADPEILLRMISEDLHKVIPILYKAVKRRHKK